MGGALVNEAQVPPASDSPAASHHATIAIASRSQFENCLLTRPVPATKVRIFKIALEKCRVDFR